MTSPDTPLPRIELLCMDSKFITAFRLALGTHWPEINLTGDPLSTDTDSKLALTIHNSALSQLPATTKFDLVVSPANSYGRLDGAFDDAISRAFCPRHLGNGIGYETLTHAAQDVLYERYRGFAPPGSCTLVPFPDALLDEHGKGINDWGCRFVGLCPTMRTPDDVRWDREVVYECIWSLLCGISEFNRGKNGEGEIGSILITPLATGVGAVSPERWASQFVLALKHFVDAEERPERWGRLGWREIQRDANEVEKTWRGERDTRGYTSFEH